MDNRIAKAPPEEASCAGAQEPLSGWASALSGLVVVYAVEESSCRWIFLSLASFKRALLEFF